MPKTRERRDIRESALVQTEVKLFSPDFLKKLRQYQDEYTQELENRRKSGNPLSEADVAKIQTRLLVKHGLIGSLKTDKT